MLGRADTLLAFDPAVMRSVVERSDALLLALGPKDQALTRRILLRLLRISDGTSVSSPRIKASLCSADEEERGNEIVEKLRGAGAIVIGGREQGDLVELRYEALLRHWQRLRDWIDERIKFREAALFWVRTGRDNGALVSAKLAKAAAEYGDLSDLEEEFVKRSREYSARWLWTLAAAAALPIFIVLAAWLAYEQWYVPSQAPYKSEVAKSSDQPMESRVHAIRWLARVQQPMESRVDPIRWLASVENYLAGRRPKDAEKQKPDLDFSNISLKAEELQTNRSKRTAGAAAMEFQKGCAAERRFE